MLAGLNGWARAHPMVAACGIAGLKNLGCDLFVQLSVGDGKVDWRRSLTFVTFGIGWVGGGQYTLFNRVYPRLLPGLQERRFRSVAGATFLDNFVHIPFLYLPLFYMTREVAFGGFHPTFATAAIQKWRKNLPEDVVLQAGIFVPAQAFSFAVNPPHLRVPFIVTVGIVWIALLSYLRGDDDGPPPPREEKKK